MYLNYQESFKKYLLSELLRLNRLKLSITFGTCKTFAVVTKFFPNSESNFNGRSAKLILTPKKFIKAINLD